MKFNTKYERMREGGEVNTGKTRVEVSGYVPAKKTIESLILSGKRLVEARKEAYEFENGMLVPDDYIDPTRNPNFDLADATALDRETKIKLAEQKQKANDKIAMEKAAEAALAADKVDEK